MNRGRERGATGTLVLIILILIIVGVLATSVLQRLTTGSDDSNQSVRVLAAGADALEQFAAVNARLPCPADPTLNTGVEDPLGGSTNCSFPEGTIPWNTVGMRYDDAFDGWGRKISYRVYAGNKGLTQPGGVSMVNCDTSAAGNADGAGLCLADHSTGTAKFFQGKGLTVNDDFGSNHSDVAYVLVSHGATGLGAYTVSGVRMDLPAGDEKKNTKDTGPFAIHAFSDPDVAATNGSHFDDLLFYRTLPDLVKRAGLSARDWP